MQIYKIYIVLGSIISKKAAESPKTLILDVKCGCGTFMKTKEKAEELARAMVDTAKGMGINTSALVTEMDVPIGRCIGNSLEVIESLQCLRGEGPHDLEELVVNLGNHLFISFNHLFKIRSHYQLREC